MRLCPDCGVTPGYPHVEGCDVARCKQCGHQALTCDHGDFSTTWTGEWPGDVECTELGVDLNQLAVMGVRGELRWDSETERWVKP